MSPATFFLLGLSLASGTAPESVVETIAGTGKPELNAFEGKASEVNLNQPFGVEIGPDGALYVCEVGNHRVLRVDLDARTIRTVAGNGKKGLSGDGGPATEASLNEPYEVRFDASGDLYFVEMQNAVVRRVERSTGKISRIAGTGEAGFAGDGGPATKAQLRQPHSIAIDRGGHLYVADIGNHRVRRVDLKSGLIDTIAGNGEAKAPGEGPAAGHPILGPRALWVQSGTLWVALREGNSLVRLDTESGQLRRVAGKGDAGWKDGPAADALFNGPKGLALTPDGAAYVMDTENHAVRRVDPGSGAVSTLAGGGPASRGFGGDGGPPLGARFDRPHGIAVSPDGRVIYVGDSDNHRVRRVKFVAR